MAVTVTEIIEDGVKYRITEDEETGLYLKEAIDEVPEPDPGINSLTELQLAVAELAEAQEQDKTEIQLALAELAEMIAGGE